MIQSVPGVEAAMAVTNRNAVPEACMSIDSPLIFPVSFMSKRASKARCITRRSSQSVSAGQVGRVPAKYEAAR